jgi:hypothetical protein
MIYKHNLLQKSSLQYACALIILLVASAAAIAQTTDSTLKKTTTFSGSVGFSSNGFSIVPTFSLNSPASMTQLSLRRNKFSFDPDIRFTTDFRKGSMIFWLRYHAITTKKYRLRVGAHPAMNFQTRAITDAAGRPLAISQMRRFFAWEVLNDYKLTRHLTAGIYYLQGNGLQKTDGAKTTHFIAFTPSLSNLTVTKALRLTIAPSAYYLNLDGKKGTYVSGAVILSHQKWPFSLQHAFNKTLTANIPGNRDYMWNVSLHYNFKKAYRKV